MEGHQVDRREQVATLTGYQFADNALGGGELVQAWADQFPVHLEDLGGIGDQVGLREVAVPVVGGLRQGGGHSHAGQAHHHFLDRLLFLPGVGDLLGPFRSQAVHLDQPAGLGLDDGQDAATEMCHHPFGHHRPIPLMSPEPL